MSAIQTSVSAARIDQPSIIKQILVSRSTLGAILEELDGGCRGSAALEALNEGALNVSAEIERLWEITKQSG